MDTKNLYDSSDPDVIVLTDNIIYDEIGEEIIMRIGRIQISLTLEEFSAVFSEIEEAAGSIHKILLTRVQHAQNTEEIN
jgi:hypothetical protein|tara:strand:- start:4984 stop:5220 length:237 start_codon:yes stop_codon:yes gene_type:complete